MQETFTLKEKMIQFFHILLPIFLTQIGLYAMNFFDVMMSGRVSAADLAGVAIGSNIWTPIFTGVSGILFALTPLVAQAFGAGKNEEISFFVVQAVYLAIFLALVVIGSGFFLLSPLLEQMHLESKVEAIAYHYLIALSLGIIALFVYTVFRCFIDALGQTKVTMLITFTSLPINLLLNYVLIFGKWGFPKLGGVGAGYATAVTYWCITFIAFYIIQKRKPLSQYKIFSKLPFISLTAWKQLMKIGIPIGFSIFFETSIFTAVALLMSHFGTTAIAAHQAAMNFASLLYMVPLSISLTLTIAVGFEVGAKRPYDAKQYCTLGIAIALSMALFASFILFFFREHIAALYTHNPNVLQLAKQFLLYAIFFQLSDAIAAPIQGALRGYKDVNSTFFMALISYWVIGLPSGYVLAHYTQIGPFGYWLGLIFGLASGALFLWIRLRFIQRQHLQTANDQTYLS
ncbi:MATE family efflux transporter [Thermolongibacillus altinsuensis]|uniref:MATE family efflux transporter n=1 Tax=Thermolongibacillus altinsuensis TaxID=575256 RepID=UPI00242A31F6|nr:MATE family efflux transporter [Thermolongibacillus altinsuensis]GMB08337.1 putative multidrug resistance protein NorM [Thermolongibacillus altinsuensis]